MDKKTWNMLTKEQKAQVIAWLRQSTCGEQVPQALRDAAADELENPTWGEGEETW